MSKLNSLSIIIPTFNEEVLIEQLCSLCCQARLNDDRLIEIIVVDAESTDDTQDIIKKYAINLIHTKKKSRATQLNLGAANASGDILYFVHADVLPPETFVQDIFNAISNGIDFGCFSYKFDHSSALLKINANFTKKDSNFIGGGDQTLFIKHSVFDTLGGYCEDHLIMEDYELYWRAKKSFKHHIVQNDALVSARKYVKNSYLRVQLANLFVFNGYRFGVRQEKLKRWHNRLLN